MQSTNTEENINGNILMTLSEVELYHVNKGDHLLMEKGSLSIIYYSSLSCFVLQIGDFKYSLYKEIPVLISTNEKDKNKSYVLPDIEGYFVLKMVFDPESPTMTTFDHILSQYVTLLEQDNDHHEKTKTEMLSEMISTGGDIVKSGLIMGAELLAKGVIAGGNYIQNKFMKKADEKEGNPEALEKFHKVESHVDSIVTTSKTQLESVKGVGLIIAESMKKKWNESSIGQKAENSAVFKTVKEIGKGTLYATGSIIMGMLEALDIIIVRGIGKSASNMFHYKYGEPKQDEEASGRISSLEQPLLDNRGSENTSVLDINSDSIAIDSSRLNTTNNEVQQNLVASDSSDYHKLNEEPSSDNKNNANQTGEA